MSFLEKNGFRAAIVIAVIFLAIPFLFPEKVPQTAGKNGSSYAAYPQKRSFVKNVFDRIGGFYGFSKGGAAAQDGVFAKHMPEGTAPSAVAPSSASAAKAAPAGKVSNATASAPSADVTSLKGSSVNVKSSSSSTGYTAPSASAARYIALDGKQYKVLKDPMGTDYAITANGPIVASRLLSAGGKYVTGKNSVSPYIYSSSPSAAEGMLNPKGYSSAGPSYKGGKGGKSPKVSSSGKISSGLSLGGVSAAKRGKSSGGGAYPRMAETYSNISNKVADISKENKTYSLNYGTNSSYGGSSYSAKAVDPSGEKLKISNNVYLQIKKNILGSPFIGNSAKEVSVKEVDMASAHTAAKQMEAVSPAQAPAAPSIPAPAEVKNTRNDFQPIPTVGKPAAAPLSLDLDMDNKEVQNIKNKKPVVQVTIGEGSGGVIPQNRDLRNKMTVALLGSNVVFKGKVANKETPDPWIVPDEDIKNAPGYAFWSVNQTSLKAGGSKYTLEEWSASDKEFRPIQKNIAKMRIDGIAADVVVLDGDQVAPKKNYFVQTGKALAGSNGSEAKKIYVVSSDEAKKDIESRNRNVKVIVYPNYVITPKNNTNYFRNIASAVSSMKEKNGAKPEKEQLSERLIGRIKSDLSKLKNDTPLN